jgi:predicted transcriptional regulator
MSKDEALSIRIPAELKAELKKLADADRRSLATTAQIALEEYVAARKAKSKRK